MKRDEAGRRLPAEGSRAGLDASEAFPLWVEFLERICEQEVTRWYPIILRCSLKDFCLKVSQENVICNLAMTQLQYVVCV